MKPRTELSMELYKTLRNNGRLHKGLGHYVWNKRREKIFLLAKKEERMIYRLPEIGDKEILSEYVNEHYDNGENRCFISRYYVIEL